MIDPELKLWVNTDGTPYYWIDVTLPQGSGFQISSHSSVPEVDDPENEIHFDVNLQSFVDGSETIQVDLGELPIDPTSGEVHVQLLDSQPQSQGKGVVRTEEATESAKPIPNF